MEVAMGWRKELQIFGNDYDTRDGTCVRDYVHVSDLARAHVLALETIDREDKSLTVNLGSETGITVTEMLETARKVTGREIPARYVGRRAGDPSELYATSSHAHSCIGWKAELSDCETLIRSTWNVYQNHRKDGENA